MRTILFQGDSITDCGRGNALGTGYPLLVTAELGAANPEKFAFYNRGISGNRIVDVYARIKADIINLKPDYMSLLIGVNDIWHELASQNGVDPDKFEMVYGLLLDEIKAALPDMKILLLEPFCLNGTATDNTEENPNKWVQFRTGVEERAARVKALAARYKLVFVPLQEAFDKAAETIPTNYWLVDGVHPSPMGHTLIKNAWLEGFQRLS